MTRKPPLPKKPIKERVKHGLRKLISSARENMKSLRRDPEWGRVRDKHLKSMPFCAACGETINLQVHHRTPVHIDKTKELDPTNLITLCMGERECHLIVGHNGSWRDYNERIDEVISALQSDN